MTIAQINQEIFNIWERHCTRSDDILVPLIYPPTLKKGGLLFIGMNPSFRKNGRESFRKLISETKYQNINPTEFFRWSNHTNFDLEMRSEIERLVWIRIHSNPSSYFKKFIEIAKSVKLNWAHIDLLFWRETSQKKVKERFFHRHKPEEPNAFAADQLMLSDELIRIVDPKLIVIPNAFASHIMKNRLNLHFCDELGCHIGNIDGRSIPFFLGSMLSGQRALDVYSYQRLKWHIKWFFDMKYDLAE